MTLASYAIFVGVLAYLFGFPMIFAEDQAIAWRRKLLKDEVVVRLFGAALALIAAMALATAHWTITQDGEGLVVFVAYVQLIKGVYLAWWPAKYAQLIAWDEEQFHAPVWQVVHGILMVLVGAFMTYASILIQH